MNIIWSNLKCYISAAPAGDFPLDSQVWKPSAFTSLHELTQVENSNNTSLPLWNISNSLGEGVQLTLEVLGSNTAENVCWVVKSVPWSWPAYHIVLILLFIFSDRTTFKFSFAPDSCWVFAAFSHIFPKLQACEKQPFQSILWLWALFIATIQNLKILAPILNRFSDCKQLGQGWEGKLLT